MAVGRDAMRHAGTIYGRTFRWLRRSRRRIEAEAEHLREVEQSGESGETPFVAILGIILFLIPIVAIVLGASFAAYYLAT
jgi:hypothetical protein